MKEPEVLDLYGLSDHIQSIYIVRDLPCDEIFYSILGSTVFAPGCVVPINSEPDPFSTLYTSNIQDGSVCSVYADSIACARNLGRHQ